MFRMYYFFVGMGDFNIVYHIDNSAVTDVQPIYITVGNERVIYVLIYGYSFLLN